MSPFSKPPTTHAQQVALLKSRGMKIDDPAQAEFYLSHLNYYRLAGYWLGFEVDHSTHTFQEGVTFSRILSLYNFDRQLRLFVLGAIERVEVSIRSQWAYHLSHLHGPHAHLDSGIHDPRYWPDVRAKLMEEVSRSDEIFIKHFSQTYSEDLPPVWAACEVMSLGLLSRWYSILQPMTTRSAISRIYDVDEMLLQSWLHHLSLVRNLCAHHARFWNSEFTITPVRPRSKPASLPSEFMTGSRKLYNTILILLHFMDTITPGHTFRGDLKKLISLHEPPVNRMGFPSNWLDRPIWQEIETAR